MASPLRSVADHMAQESAYGDWQLLWEHRVTAATAANANSGSISGTRSIGTITVPTMTSPVIGAYCTSFNVTAATTSTKYVLADETTLGVLTVSGNSFSGAASMGTGKIYDHTLGAAGSSQTLATHMPMLVVTTAFAGSNPVVTVTYTNQAGTTGRTCTMTLPTSGSVLAINTSYFMAPHLQGSDTGIRAVTGMSISTGSAGVLTVFGLIPVGISEANSQAVSTGFNPILAPIANYLLQGGDRLAFYQIGSTIAGARMCHATFSPES